MHYREGVNDLEKALDSCETTSHICTLSLENDNEIKNNILQLYTFVV